MESCHVRRNDKSKFVYGPRRLLPLVQQVLHHQSFRELKMVMLQPQNVAIAHDFPEVQSLVDIENSNLPSGLSYNKGRKTHEAFSESLSDSS
jgi:hypothetical protein